MLPSSILKKSSLNLHRKPNHPINILNLEIRKIFQDKNVFVTDQMNSVVSVKDNFDSLLIPKDHPSRGKSDTFYISDDYVLRTHTSAHQVELLSNGHGNFIVIGDVYRRDEIDRFHYPIFHQMEGVFLLDDKNPKEYLSELIGLIIRGLLGDIEYRLVDSYFPFTTPSWEVEVLWKDKWVELLGCGQVHPEIAKHSPRNTNFVAFGVGLDRLAMMIFDIPDIRLLWSEDTRFTSQFQDINSRFKPFSSQPTCYKDVSFWLSDKFNYNEMCEIIREEAGDLVESITKLDTFTKGDKISETYRINYCSFERTLSNEEVNEIQSSIIDLLKTILNVVIR